MVWLKDDSDQPINLGLVDTILKMLMDEAVAKPPSPAIWSVMAEKYETCEYSVEQAMDVNRDSDHQVCVFEGTEEEAQSYLDWLEKKLRWLKDVNGNLVNPDRILVLEVKEATYMETEEVIWHVSAESVCPMLGFDFFEGTEEDAHEHRRKMCHALNKSEGLLSYASDPA